MTTAPRTGILTPEKRGDDVDASIRPLTLLDFTGQEAARKNLKVFIEAAKALGEGAETPALIRRGLKEMAG
jgi:holliday junction DNA helicase RuvB